MKAEPVICPECGAVMILRQTSKYKYANGRPRKFYGCSTWPRCNAAHGAHPDGRPLGIPGDKITKMARMITHRIFDRFADYYHLGRDERYEFLSDLMGMTREEAHIARFNIEQCRQVILGIRDVWRSIYAG